MPLHARAVTRAVILARGLGTRMRAADAGAVLDAAQEAAAAAGQKGMMPVGAHPLLDHVLSTFADAGVTDACLVVAPEHAAIRAHYEAARPVRLRVHYAVQAEPRGTADALLAAAGFLGDGHAFVGNADNHYPLAALRALGEAGGEAVAGFDADDLVAGSAIPRERLRRFALLVRDTAGALADIVEKPDDATWARLAPGALVSMNFWVVGPAIVAACRRVRPSARGELELPQAVRLAVHEDGATVRVVPVRGPVLDLSGRRDVAGVAARLADHAVRL